MELSRYEKKWFSQNGEDGITIKLVDIIYGTMNDPNKYYVEFGVENGKECNTRILREKYGWRGLQMDGSNHNEKINLQREFITKENITQLFEKYNVPKLINVLSVDIDFNDFYCLHEILKNYVCDIIICEYNGCHFPTEDKIVVYNSTQTWDTTNYFGASLLSMVKLCSAFNYTLVYCNANGVNAFFINNEIINKLSLNFLNMEDIMKLYRPSRYGNGPNGGHKQDQLNRKYLTYDEAILL